MTTPEGTPVRIFDLMLPRTQLIEAYSTSGSPAGMSVSGVCSDIGFSFLWLVR